MAKILVYNNSTNKMETYTKSLTDAMPYNVNSTLTVDEFRGSSNSNILWTDRRTMISWNNFRTLYGKSIYVGYAFKRPWEGGHSNLSQHYAGLAFDVAQNLSASARNTLRNLAITSGYWRYIEPAVDTPTWVHFDDRWISSGYPTTQYGSKGVYVLVAQDSLNTLGYSTGGLDGIFGTVTKSAVLSYQESKSLTADGIIGTNTWKSLMANVVGNGSTSTTVLDA